MCGRFTITSIDDLADEFGEIEVPAELKPRYNIAPTQSVPVITNSERQLVQLVRWGLVPYWAKDLAIGNRMINARLETVASKPAFRAAFALRRCLVLADGFFEWKRAGRAKIPYYIRLANKRPFAFAGLWERWKAPDNGVVISCAIITGDANEVMAPIHDRMPVIVAREDRERWLCPDRLAADAVADILAPPPAEGLEIYEVSPLVNSPRNDVPECVAPAEKQQRLFD